MNVHSNVQKTTKNIITLGASILPYAIDPIYNNMYLLLGREKNWYKTHKSKSMWCDFGGKRSSKFEESEGIAAREFYEESLGLCKITQSDIVPLENFQHVSNHLKKKKFTYKLSYIISQNETEKRVYDMYFLHVPFQPDLKLLFSKTRETIISIKNLKSPAVSGSMQVNPSYLEKLDLEWFSIPSLRSGVMEGKLKNVPLRDHFLYRLPFILEKIPYFLPKNYKVR